MIPIMESCQRELRCRGAADHIVYHPAQAQSPPVGGETLWLLMSAPPSTSPNKEIIPQ